MDHLALESDSLWLSFESSPFVNLSSEIHPLIFSTLDELSFQRLASTCKLWNKIVIPFATNLEIQKITKLFEALLTILNSEDIAEKNSKTCFEILIDCIAKGCLFQDNFILFKKSVKALEFPIHFIFYIKQLTVPLLSSLTVPFLLNSCIKTSALPLLEKEFPLTPSTAKINREIKLSKFNGFCYVIYEFCKNNEFEHAVKHLDNISDAELKNFMLEIIIKQMCCQGLFKEATKLVEKASHDKRLKFCMHIQNEESKTLGEYQVIYTPETFLKH